MTDRRRQRERQRGREKREYREKERETHWSWQPPVDLMTEFWDVIMHVIMVIYVWSHNSIIIVSSKLSYDLVNTGHFDCLTINTSREKDTEKERDWDRLTISRSPGPPRSFVDRSLFCRGGTLGGCRIVFCGGLICHRGLICHPFFFFLGGLGPRLIHSVEVTENYLYQTFFHFQSLEPLYDWWH